MFTGLCCVFDCVGECGSICMDEVIVLYLKAIYYLGLCWFWLANTCIDFQRVSVLCL